VTDEEQADAAILRFLHAARLVPSGCRPRMRRLTGGISSDIWLIETCATSFCVKRALPKLRVATDWWAPVERNANEAAWFEVVAGFMPEAVPAILAQDDAAGAFAMEYLPERDYPNWKALLREGKVSFETAAQVGARLARIHGVTAKSSTLAARFASDGILHAIRLEPYLLATARKHRDLAARLEQIAATTTATRLTLVHGDVSPKNILIGARGPVFLDAECAWWGDPAFDLAFCLNHLLLKCLLVPRATQSFIEAFRALARTYLRAVDWESADAIEQRTSHLLPGLFLSRVDGKSPVEYVTEESEKDRVRKVATALLHQPVSRLDSVADAWRASCREHFKKKIDDGR
jgi:aminoglycoside phosphotransferase (APT) family kinase protein